MALRYTIHAINFEKYIRQSAHKGKHQHIQASALRVLFRVDYYTAVTFKHICRELESVLYLCKWHIITNEKH